MASTATTTENETTDGAAADGPPPAKRARPNDEDSAADAAVAEDAPMTNGGKGDDGAKNGEDDGDKASATKTNGESTENGKKEAIGDEEEGNDPLDGVIDPSVLSSESELSAEYAAASPYPHGCIRPLCPPAFLSAVLDEVKANSTVRFKESDLFRVYQSIDLANLVPGGELAAKMPNLMKLREALYSAQFRELAERLTGLEKGTLVDRVDCAANCHARGCHLLCHDDVIGTRKVSYIIYLTDPDEEWTDEDGGRLELYDSSPERAEGKEGEKGSGDTGRRVPHPFPSATLLPHFNSLAFFVVQPGVSFHSVQEVFADRPRLSIQGWYHAKDKPAKSEDATLSRLKERAEEEGDVRRGEDTEGGFLPFAAEEEGGEGKDKEAGKKEKAGKEKEVGKKEEEAGNEKVAGKKEEAAAASASTSKAEAAKDDEDDDAPPPLSESDLSHLSLYLNPLYLDPSSLADIRKRFEEDSSVLLRKFLNEEWADKLAAVTKKEDERDGLGRGKPSLNYEVGVGKGWEARGPAHKQRFLEYAAGTAEGADAKEDATDEDEAKAAKAGPLLSMLRRELLTHPSFSRYLCHLTSLPAPSAHRSRVRRFRPGLDYTVAHYGALTQRSVLDATLVFCAGKGDQPEYDEDVGDLIGTDDDATWETGDAGGFECYISAEDEDAQDTKGKTNREAADEYDDEDDTELLSVSAGHNTLSLVYRDPGTVRFVKYVGSSAPGSRWDVSAEYELPEEEEGTGDGDEEGKEGEKEETKGGKEGEGEGGGGEEEAGTKDEGAEEKKSASSGKKKEGE